MYGAILGDIIGSPYEFDSHNIKTKEFELFSERSEFTDDSIMTLAVADAVMTAGRDASDEELKKALVNSMQTIGRRYPFAGYGMKFSSWLYDDDPKPYDSFGNGSAMRVSSIPWLFQDDFVRMLHVARLSAEVTHNHPEGVKGAVSVAAAIFLAIHGKDKETIKKHVTGAYKYDLSRTCDQIRPDYHHVESCQETVPEAMTAFLEGKDFEDVIRTAVSLGGDSDTLTCIAGSMAEAFFGVPQDLKDTCRDMLTSDLLEILDRFDAALEKDRKEREADPEKKARWENALNAPPKAGPVPENMRVTGNEMLEEKIREWNRNRTQEGYTAILGTLAARCLQGARVLVPAMPLPMKEGEKGVPRLRPQLLKTRDGKLWQGLFTSVDQLKKTGSKNGAVLSMPMTDLFKQVLASEKGPVTVAGLVINPADPASAVQIPARALSDLMQAAGTLAQKTGRTGGNKITFVKGDILKIKAEAIVNAANGALSPGGGVCGIIHQAAGPELARECASLGGCETGGAKITKGYRLEQKYVIHAVGPVYDGTERCAGLLASAYKSSLDLAKEKGLHSIAFPAISTGIFGYPKKEAAQVALGALTQWFRENASYGMTIYMVAYDQETFDIYKQFAPEKKS